MSINGIQKVKNDYDAKGNLVARKTQPVMVLLLLMINMVDRLRDNILMVVEVQ